MISLEVWRSGSLHIYTLCVMMISLEVCKLTNLQVVCDDDKDGSLQVYMLCVMMISLEVYTFTRLQV